MQLQSVLADQIQKSEEQHPYVYQEVVPNFVGPVASQCAVRTKGHAIGTSAVKKTISFVVHSATSSGGFNLLLTTGPPTVPFVIDMFFVF